MSCLAYNLNIGWPMADEKCTKIIFFSEKKAVGHTTFCIWLTVLIYDDSLVVPDPVLYKNYLLFLLYNLITHTKGFFQILKEISPLFIVNCVIDEHTNCNLLLKGSSYISRTSIMCKCLKKKKHLRRLFSFARV